MHLSTIKRGTWKVLSFLVIFCAAFSAFFGLISTAQAAIGDLGFKWNTSTAVVRDLLTSYSSYTIAAQQNFDSTDMTVGWSTTTNAGSGVVYYDQLNYGNTGWVATTDAYSGSTACFTPTGVSGYCNYTNHKATLGYVHYNTYYASELNVPNKAHMIARHELGHAFGMGHPTVECEDTIMRFLYCGVLTSLRPMDITWLNNQY